MIYVPPRINEWYDYLPVHEGLMFMELISIISIGLDIPDSSHHHPFCPASAGVKTSRTCADRSGWCCLLCGGFQGSGWMQFR